MGGYHQLSGFILTSSQVPFSVLLYPTELCTLNIQILITLVYELIFKNLIIVLKAFSTGSPDNVAELLHSYNPSRNLRSGNQLLSLCPTAHSMSGERAFSYFAVCVWNKIPFDIKKFR